MCAYIDRDVNLNSRPVIMIYIQELIEPARSVHVVYIYIYICCGRPRQHAGDCAVPRYRYRTELVWRFVIVVPEFNYAKSCHARMTAS